MIEGVRMADVSKPRPSQQQQPSWKGGGTTTPHDKCVSVGERLYSQVHVCNHARCAANDPDYNKKSTLPPKKFLVAKKHTYGGLDEQGGRMKWSGSSSTTTSSSDHHCNRNHALQSLTNSVLSLENVKARPHGPRSTAHSMQQSRRASVSNSSDGKKIVEKKGRLIPHPSNSGHSGSSTGRSGVTTESHPTGQKSRLSNASSMPCPSTEQSEHWEGSASPESTITSIRITQITSTRRRGEEQEEPEEDEIEEFVEVSSPTASVGSNHGIETSSLKETFINLEGGDFEHSTLNSGELESPAPEILSSDNLLKHSVNEDTACDSSPSLSVDSSSPDSVVDSLAPSTPARTVASTAPEISSVTKPQSEISSSNLLQSAVDEEEMNHGSPAPVESKVTITEPLTSSVTSTKSRLRSSPTSTGRSSRSAPVTSSASTSKLGRKLISNLKESSKVGSPLSPSSGASANRPSRISRSPVSNPQITSSPTQITSSPSSTTRLGKKFVTDLQARPVARKASRKGVRSIELRGGKAQSYSTTTVTSWNVTTTTVETSVSLSETSPEKNSESVLSADGLGGVSFTASELTAAAGLHASATIKFVKNANGFEEVHAESEKVSLRHGEVAERRLSEEYLTNHALEGVVKKISDNDHRVKVLVHAFETLAALSDSEVLDNEDKALNPQLVYGSVSATTIAV